MYKSFATPNVMQKNDWTAFYEVKKIVVVKSEYQLILNTLRKMGWHWSTIARSKPRTMNQPRGLAGEHQQDRSEHRSVRRWSWMFHHTLHLA